MTRPREIQNPRDTGKYNTSPGGECCACASPATHWVRIANDKMRGNDTSVDVCARHESMARANFVRFMSHAATKEPFLKDPDAMKDLARERREKDAGRR